MMRRVVCALALLGAANGPGCGSGGDGGDECLQDADCPPGRYCRVTTGECASDCTDDRECPEGFVCTHRGRCERGCRPTNGGVEACDGEDNDCNGQIDDLDPRACTKDNQYGSCAGSETCENATWFCDAATPAPEICDGADNDCDGETDEDLGPRDCPLQAGVCAGTRQECQGGAGWSVCDYGLLYEPDEEVSCDQLDNDCDGQTDESAEPLDLCELGELATDGIDNNCNGIADEPGGCMRRVPARTPYIDQYENTVYENPDCTGRRYGENGDDYPAGWPDDGVGGTVTLYACSVPGVRPSRSITWHQARRACAAQGKHLCKKSEWATACAGPSVTQLCYGHSYNATICNTFSAGVGDTIPAGSKEGCVSDNGCYDMSGNLWEWTDDTCEWDTTRKNVQGGSYICTYCDGDDCVPCDLDDPDQHEEFEWQHGCQTMLDGWYCTLTNATGRTSGFRCCYDPP